MVERDVGDRRDAAIPGVGRVEPATEPDLDQRDIEVRLGEVAEDHRRQQLELGRLAVAARDPVGDGQHRLDMAREVGDRDRPAVDRHPLAIRDEVRLGGLADPQPRGPQRAAGERQHAALPVGPRDQCATHGELRVAEGGEQGARPAESQPDPEPTPGGERRQRLVVVGGA